MNVLSGAIETNRRQQGAAPSRWPIQITLPADSGANYREMQNSVNVRIASRDGRNPLPPREIRLAVQAAARARTARKPPTAKCRPPVARRSMPPFGSDGFAFTAPARRGVSEGLAGWRDGRPRLSRRHLRTWLFDAGAVAAPAYRPPYLFKAEREMNAVRPVNEPLGRPIRLGVLVSGGGTTLVNVLERIADGRRDAEVPLVIASRPDCRGVERAKAAGLKTRVIARREFADTEAFSDAVFEQLREARVDLVTLAGFLSLLRIPDDFRHRVFNIHPALIPSFCGKGLYGHHVHEAVLARGVKVSGCTVHFADNVYDHGPIVVQECVPVHEGDTPETLAARVFQAECDAYPRAVELFAAGRLVIDGSRVQILD